MSQSPGSRCPKLLRLMAQVPARQHAWRRQPPPPRLLSKSPGPTQWKPLPPSPLSAAGQHSGPANGFAALKGSALQHPPPCQ